MNSRVTHKHIFHFRCAKAMTADIDDVIHAARDTVITLLSAVCTVAREIVT